MKRLVGLIATVGVLASLAGGAWAHQTTPTPSAMSSPMASPAAVATGAAFLVIANHGVMDDVLISATSTISMSVEIHETENHDGVMSMHPVDHGVEIDAGETVTFKPGGYHFMLIGLTRDLTPGMTFELKLTFKSAGTVTVPVLVRTINGALPAASTPPAAVNLGTITIDQAWARPAPAMGVMPSMNGTPAASPAAN